MDIFINNKNIPILAIQPALSSRICINVMKKQFTRLCCPSTYSLLPGHNAGRHLNWGLRGCVARRHTLYYPDIMQGDIQIEDYGVVLPIDILFITRT
jgi:hypothetical protein